MKFTFDTGSNTISYDTSSADLNQYLVGLNGAFQGAGWKILQNARDNFLTAYNRKNNIIEAYKTDNTTEKFLEPPIQWNLPMKHVVSVANSTTDIEIVSPYENVNDNFAGDDLKQTLKDEVKDEEYRFNPSRNETLYDKLLVPPEQVKVKSVEYSDYIFPKKELVGLKNSRIKENYDEITGTIELDPFDGIKATGYARNTSKIKKIWNSNINKRIRPNEYQTNSKVGSINSLNFFEKTASISYYTSPSNANQPFTMRLFKNNSNKSVWPLDNFVYVTPVSLNTATKIIQFTNFIYGDLAPMNESEASYFLQPITGTITTNIVTQSNQVIKNYFVYEYARNTQRVSPRGQFLYLNVGDDENNNKYLNLGAPYKTNELSNNSPWYDSYDEFAGDVNTKIYKNYTFLPEYRVSDHIDFYITGATGFDFPPKNYLSLEGFEDEKIFNFTSSNKINGDLLYQTSLSTLNKSKLKIKINAVKKLLPYNGFYPQQACVKIIDLFQKSFFGLSTTDIFTGRNNSLNPIGQNSSGLLQNFHIESGSSYSSGYFPGSSGIDAVTSKITGAIGAGAPFEHQVATIIQPYFAPGILFNTIKASMAVSWPTFITKSYDYRQLTIDQTWTLNGLIYEQYNHTFKFEDLLDINNSIPAKFKDMKSDENFLRYLNSNYVFRNPAVVPEYKVAYEFNTYNKNWAEKNPLYRLGINNFLAEVPNFFLKNGKLNNFLSKPQKLFKSVVSGTTYFMDVVVERDSEQKQFIPRFIEGVSSGSNYYLSEESFYGPRPILRSSVYGASAFESSSLVYAPFAPPYHYGKSTARISYKPDFSGKVSLTDILSNAKIQFLNDEQENDFNLLDATLSSSLRPITNLNIYKSRMTLSSSINFFQVSNLSNLKYDEFGNPIDVQEASDDSNNVWSIQTKFETPLLNFNTFLNNDEINGNGFYNVGVESIDGLGYDSYTGVRTLGLWSGYGETPSRGRGINFYIQETFNERNEKTGSLIDLCGFNVSSRDIGEIADKKIISEAVILIPYVELGEENFNDNDRAKNIPSIVGENDVGPYETKTRGPFYFSVDLNTISSIVGNNFRQIDIDQMKKILNKPNIDANNSIVKTLKAMIDYNVPPHLNWLFNKTIKPFVMYIIDFEEELDKQDLSDIWQGLMPKISKISKNDFSILEHELKENEFFHGKKIPDKLKFKVFKIKKRANINYYDLTDGSSDDNRFKFSFNNFSKPFYSYNWPYDYFSLIELVNIEAGFTSSGSL